MNILSIDTSTETLSIALSTEASYEERLVKGNFSHSENLLSEMESLLSRAKLGLKDLDLVVCTQGPGSFTGLRVGMASLKAIRSASGAKLVSIPTLEAIDATARELYHGVICSVIDAKKKRFYLELRDEKRVLIPVRDGNPEDILDVLSGYGEILVTGPDAEKFASKLKEEDVKCRVLVDGAGMRNLSRELIRLARIKLEQVGEDEIGAGPLYIRRSDAEEALLKKMSEQGR